ncbi:hypothetical protein DU506_11625 [Vreelandella rituensis]|uniref:Uncharacterized protein n=1 Tax=Vreelandella rituensis TaxID=2282306 RepID=A0A368U043_9GAMM|nr:hypothetical protein DU506_11625 [Halomonas rituensis]
MIGSLGLSAPVLGTASERSEAETRAIIEEALSAAPPQVARTATVIDLDGNVVREGSGAYTCLPGPPGFGGPMCHDEQFMKWMQAFMNGEEAPPVSEIGTSYMLAGDSLDGGASNIDPAASTPTADNQWVVEGPHVMLIVPDPALLEGLPTTPDANGPYVMWPDSPYAHVMWPVDERPRQRLPADQ